MIDTHAHLDFPQYDGDRENLIKDSFEKGLEAIINIGTDLETSQKSLNLANRYDAIYTTIGVHPHDSKNVPSDYMNRLRALAAGDYLKKIVGVGEIGLDYYRDLSPRDIQKRVFREQLELAKDLKLPVVVHIREAIQDSMQILRESGINRGVLHSFPGSKEEAKAAIEMGFYISFAGPITYPKSNKAEVAESLPLSRILVETDSPYLTPQTFRGQRNKPLYVRYVIEKLSSVFSPYTFNDIERITSLNARQLFNLPIDKIGKIVYKIRNSLYVNLTDRCTNNCDFCLRGGPSKGYVSGHYLYLKSEPNVNDIIDAIAKERDFNEIVFCGLGEPTIRLKELLEVASAIKRSGKSYPIRLNTNGQGSLINKLDLPSKLIGLVDVVSVSLNAHNADTYLRLCKPDKGKEAYEAVIKFIGDCVRTGIKTEASIVDLPVVDIKACREITDKLGVSLRVRQYYKGEI